MFQAEVDHPLGTLVRLSPSADSSRCPLFEGLDRPWTGGTENTYNSGEFGSGELGIVIDKVVDRIVRGVVYYRLLTPGGIGWINRCWVESVR
jgi:hypothetical protein